MSTFKNLSLGLISALLLASCGAGNGGAPAAAQQPVQPNWNGVPGQPGPVANGALAPIPTMNFTCGPHCIEIKRSRWNGGTRSLQNKRFDIAVLPNSIPNCQEYRNLYRGQEIARQRPKLRGCLPNGQIGMTCSTIVSRQNKGWEGPTGEPVSRIAAGQYLVCASVDTNGDRIMNNNEFYSESRITVNPVQTIQYTGPVYPNQPQPQIVNPQLYQQQNQIIPLNPASTHWDGGSPVYDYYY